MAQRSRPVGIGFDKVVKVYASGIYTLLLVGRPRAIQLRLRRLAISGSPGLDTVTNREEHTTHWLKFCPRRDSKATHLEQGIFAVTPSKLAINKRNEKQTNRILRAASFSYITQQRS